MSATARRAASWCSCHEARAGTSTLVSHVYGSCVISPGLLERVPDEVIGERGQRLVRDEPHPAGVGDHVTIGRGDLDLESSIGEDDVDLLARLAAHGLTQCLGGDDPPCEFPGGRRFDFDPSGHELGVWSAA